MTNTASHAATITGDTERFYRLSLFEQKLIHAFKLACEYYRESSGSELQSLHFDFIKDMGDHKELRSGQATIAPNEKSSMEVHVTLPPDFSRAKLIEGIASAQAVLQNKLTKDDFTLVKVIGRGDEENKRAELGSRIYSIPLVKLFPDKVAEKGR